MHCGRLVGQVNGYNLEMDLYRSVEMCNKCADFRYAQSLYAALCNNEWIPLDTMEVLKGIGWMCSWRYAGNIVAKMRDAVEVGDYMDFYCSGMNEDALDEGTITNEIREDMRKIGWGVIAQ